MRAARTRHLVALATAATLLVTSGPPPVRSASGEISLAGTTVITARESSSVVVRVPKDVPYAFTADGPALISLSGDGRAVAATLQPLDSHDISRAIVVAQFNGCAAAGCARDPDQPVWLYRRPGSGARTAPDGRLVLAAGAYRLTVLADGHPVQVRLLLDGVQGSASGETATFAEGGITPAAEVLAAPGSPVAWSGSADMTFASQNSLLLAYLQQDSPSGAVAGVAGVCHFTGSTRPLLGVPAPGCPFEPNGSAGEARVGSVATETLTIGSASRARLATALTPTTGVQQVGLWSTRAALTTTPLAFFAWLRLT